MTVVPVYKRRLLALYWVLMSLCFMAHALLNYFNPFLFNSSIEQASVVVSIPEGSNIKQIARSLHEYKAISSPLWFVAYVSLRGWEKELKYGEYQFFKGDTPIDIAAKIQRADVVTHQITVVEGWRFKDLKAHLNKLKTITHTIKEKTDEEIAKILDIPTAFLDGAFLPNTYYYNYGESDINLLRRFRHAMQEVFKQEFNNQQTEHTAFSTWTHSVQDEYKVLSLAAIIEKEAVTTQEYKIISSVFHNRLLKNMLLQADPTVIYAAGDRYKGVIRKRHLRFKSPYNTYTTKGLPPFPIAYAGVLAIRAAINPVKSDYLYFVAKGDGREHFFNSSLKEHNKMVKRYWNIIEKRNN